jgi:hypothetical protein
MDKENLIINYELNNFFIFFYIFPNKRLFSNRINSFFKLFLTSVSFEKIKSIEFFEIS